MTEEPRSEMSSLELAALASAALPTLQLREIRGPLLQADSGSWVHLADASGSQWLAWAPTTPLSEDGAARYLAVLELLDEERAHGHLSWVAPKPAGEASSTSCAQVVLLEHPGGEALEVGELSGSDLLPASLGCALASLHEMDAQSYAAASRRYADAAITRKALRSLVERHSTAIPSRLRSRWLDAIDEDSLWRFDPVPLHGSMSAECVYASNGAVVGVTRFDQAAVGDPAQDVVWLMYYATDEFLEAFEAAYSRSRSAPDLHLLTRAQLLSELETLRWYAHGVDADSKEWRGQGVRALRDLDRDIGDHRLVPSRPNVVEITFTAEEEPLLRLKPSEPDSGPEITPPAPTGSEDPTDVLNLDAATGLYTPFAPAPEEPDGSDSELPLSEAQSQSEASAKTQRQRPIRRGPEPSKVPGPQYRSEDGTGSIEVP